MHYCMVNHIIQFLGQLQQFFFGVQIFGFLRNDHDDICHMCL